MLSLFKFKGGVKPPTHKTESNASPIRRAPLPSRLAVPLHQSIGGTPHPTVVAGERVAKGQKIGDADGWISAAVHAPTSGVVKTVEMVVQPHVSGLSALAVIIEPDGRDEWIEHGPQPIRSADPQVLRRALQEAGVVGLGGAAFPSHAKLSGSPSVPLDELVINGAECEPFITCDDRLMRERADDVVRGIALFRDVMQPKKVLIGIEDNKPEAIAAMRDAVQRLGENFMVVGVPTLYPAGGAKQLIRVLTGKKIAGTTRLTTDHGVQCFNVGTAYAAWRAVGHGEPVLSRILTLAGNVAQPGNWEVPIGASIDEVLALAGPQTGTDGVIMGGPMMGSLLPDTKVPVVKATNCLIARSPALFPPKPPEMPCIRCGECAKACPHELQPFEMYWWSRARNFGKAQEYKLFDCIECGCCAFVCPSRIPLVQYFRFAKGEIWARERDKKAAEGAKARFEFKTFRDEREKQEKAERLTKAAAAQKAKAEAEAAAAAKAAEGAPAAGGAPAAAAPAAAAPAAAAPAAAATAAAATASAAPATGEADKKALIAAAMERAKAQREAAAAAQAAAEVAPATAPAEATAPADPAAKPE